MKQNIPQIRNADIHFSINGDIHIFLERDNTSYYPKKRGVMGCFHLIYQNIEQKKDFTHWINVGIRF